MHQIEECVLPTATRAEVAPLVMLTPEFWGDRVAERRVERKPKPGAIAWAQLSAEPVLGAADPEAVRPRPPSREVDLDALMRLAAAPEAPSIERRTARSTFAAALKVASAVGLTSAVGLAGYVVLTFALDAAPALSAPALSVGAGRLSPVVSSFEAKTEPTFEALTATREGARGGYYTASLIDSAPEGEEPSRAPERRRSRRPAVTSQATAQAPAPALAARAPLARREDRESPLEGSMRFGLEELLPDQLSSTQVSLALRPLAPMIRNCGAEEGPRVAPVSLTISGDTGRVTSAQLRGPLAGSAEGECIERALRRARFPRFAAASHSLSRYPLVVR